jgi:hypothetical protein
MKSILKHMLIGFKVSYNIFYGSLLALIHKLIPDLFKISQAIKLKNFMILSIKRNNNNNDLIKHIKVND